MPLATSLLALTLASCLIVGIVAWLIVKPCLVEMRRCDCELQSSRQARRERMNRELKERRQAADHLRVGKTHTEIQQ